MDMAEKSVKFVNYACVFRIDVSIMFGMTLSNTGYWCV
jgi:hypothetical protein